MTYLRQPHHCPLPGWSQDGDIWRCDECGRVWRFTNPGNPNYAGWRRLGWLGRLLRGVR